MTKHRLIKPMGNTRLGIPLLALSIRFHPGCLVVHCQTLEQAIRLWETRSTLQIAGLELCFHVNDTLYVGASLG